MSATTAAAFCAALVLSLLMTCCSSETCKSRVAVDMPNAHMLSNGSVWDPDEQTLYPPNTYRMEGGLARGCPCLLERPCLRKCCAKGSAMNFTTLKCIPYNKPFQPNITVDETGRQVVVDNGHFGIIYGNSCFGYLLEPQFYPEDRFVIDYDNGTLTVPAAKAYGLGPDDFCLEYFPKIDTYLPYKCFEAIKTEECGNIRFILYPIGMVVSVIFLLISITVYFIVPKLRNLCGKCLICQMTSLLFSYISLATVQALGDGLSDDSCVALGFFIYFSLLCYFFWLNVLCIDITLAFSTFRPIGGNHAERDKKKFIIYSLYAWGMPLLLTTVSMVLELHPQVPDSAIKPKFKNTCWFNDYRGRMFFFVGPVGIIVVCNLILFLITARKIYLINKENEKNRGKEDEKQKTKRDKRRFRLYIKLYVVMGVTWILEIMSFVIGGSACIWIFPDMINTLQGFFIFLILICNRKVIRLLKARFHIKKEPSETDPCSGFDDNESCSDHSVTSTTSSGAPVASTKNNFKLESQDGDRSTSSN